MVLQKFIIFLLINSFVIDEFKTVMRYNGDLCIGYYVETSHSMA